MPSPSTLRPFRRALRFRPAFAPAVARVPPVPPFPLRRSSSVPHSHRSLDSSRTPPVALPAWTASFQFNGSAIGSSLRFSASSATHASACATMLADDLICTQGIRAQQRRKPLRSRSQSAAEEGHGEKGESAFSFPSQPLSSFPSQPLSSFLPQPLSSFPSQPLSSFPPQPLSKCRKQSSAGAGALLAACRSALIDLFAGSSGGGSVAGGNGSSSGMGSGWSSSSIPAMPLPRLLRVVPWVPPSLSPCPSLMFLRLPYPISAHLHPLFHPITLPSLSRTHFSPLSHALLPLPYALLPTLTRAAAPSLRAASPLPLPLTVSPIPLHLQPFSSFRSLMISTLPFLPAFLLSSVLIPTIPLLLFLQA
ncbi:unnamed protein product [Closterium sp. Naga37s-1]|nr:unnamed protein product [Closterium sp. Naga37s-1]